MLKLIRFLFLISFVVFAGCSNNKSDFREFSYEKRPIKDEILFDYTGSFENIKESSRRFLTSLRSDYNIESCVVAVPNLPGNKSIQEASVEILNNWGIGRNNNGKGLLLLFNEETREVKVEVSYDLEDVFTDLFTGYAEDLQLQPNYRSGNLEVGIIAVFEEIEKRAELKKFGNYTPDEIAKYDHEFLSGGGGAAVDLKTYIDAENREGNDLTGTNRTQKFAQTPEDAWSIMVHKWAGLGESPHIDIYTEATKMAMGDQNNPNDRRVTEQAQKLLEQQFYIKQENNFALIHFKRGTGWEFAPYLFANNGEGWKFDIVNQRKLVVFSSGDTWRLERGDHNYNIMFSGFKSSLRKDIPFSEDIFYKIEDDKDIAAKIIELEKKFKSDPNDFSTALELGRLGVVTARRPRHVYDPLNKAKELSPGSPLPNKFLAVYNVMSNFQYKTALDEMKAYNRKVSSIFGYSFAGFLYYKLQDYKESIKFFQKSIELEPSLYAYCKLSRAEAMLYISGKKELPLFSNHKENAVKAFEQARATAGSSWRVQMLQRWLEAKKVM
jgi:tetratricopeptide (TPR) repeat protein